MTKTLTPQDAIQATADSINGRVYEREEMVELILTGLLSDTNIFVLGVPGVAKTYTFNLLRDHIADLAPGDWFQILMTRYTTPSNVFGALDMQAMKESVHRHSIDYRSFAVAKFGFFDEIWKTNGPMANSLLSAFNEHVFFNDVPVEMDLFMVAGASNEMPQGEDMGAIFDRFGFRFVANPLRTTSNKRRMLESYFNKFAPVEQTLTWDLIREARSQVNEVVLTDDVIDALVEMHTTLRNEGLAPSDRRIQSTIPVIQATAWRRGAAEAEIEDMHLLNHMMWDEPKDKSVADKVVLGLAAPLDAEAMKLRDELDKLTDEMNDILRNGDNDVQRRQAAISFHGKLKSAEQEAKSLKSRAKRPSAKIDSLHTDTQDLMRRMLRDLLMVDPDSVRGSD